jgi:hypothetical protein
MMNKSHEFFSEDFLYEEKNYFTGEQEARELSKKIMKDLKDKYCNFKNLPKNIEFNIDNELDFAEFCEMYSLLEASGNDIYSAIKEYLFEMELKKSENLNLLKDIYKKLIKNG